MRVLFALGAAGTGQPRKGKEVLSGMMIIFCVMIGVWVHKCMHFSRLTE